MSADPVLPPRVPDMKSEARLLQIRQEAELKGRVDAPGVRLPGAPFPQATPENGYYGVPLLKQPQWKWQIPVYFFVGGAAGSSAVIGAMAHWTGKDENIARDARLLAAAGAMLSSGLLISDLGRPSRFLNMLRVIKHQSPMSVGAWTLAAFATFSGATAAAQLFNERIQFAPVRIAGNVTEAISAIVALPFSNYTGVLIGATVVPVWNHNIRTLPIHFGMSGLNSAVSLLELLGHDRSPALNVLGMAASAIETYEGVELELKRDPRVNAPLKHGVSGWITRAGGVLSGPVPLGLRLVAAASGPRRSRRIRRAAAICSIAGSLLTRIGWVRAGHASTKDWRIPLRLAEEQREKPLQSRVSSPV